MGQCPKREYEEKYTSPYGTYCLIQQSNKAIFNTVPFSTKLTKVGLILYIQIWRNNKEEIIHENASLQLLPN